MTRKVVNKILFVGFLVLEMFIFGNDRILVEQETIGNFLKRTHEEVKKRGTVHLVLGNQSADLDSIVSAIAIAYSGCFEGFYIPLINIPKDELFLRKDVLHVFDTLDIDPDVLLYREDLEPLTGFGKSVFITLVDHNELAPGQEHLGKLVERVIDHRHDGNVGYPLMPESEKIIKRNASNSTIVAQIISEHCCLSPQAAYMLLSAILLDTRNITNLLVSDEDIATANMLKAIAGEYYSDSLFDILYQLRHDVHDLSPDLILRRDYKLFNEGKLLYGMATIPTEVSWSVENLTVWHGAFIELAEKQNIHLLCTIGYRGLDRTLIVYIPDQKLAKAFQKHVKKTSELNRELAFEEHCPEEGLFFYTHRLGRKLLQPLFSFAESAEIQNALYP